ncbi:hypothetical protein LTR56_004951 [Elasticomyces elasticus]|nr:hypothetical protein LTR22_015766 [Elasticomyces elasticus]KAK3652657.1 hypothetical protein LTR56_004951 [Elasticomyces elasticus]KAK4914587.1 hypothetical protein LTR49_017154 [Elasticomyces elasticus]KAK5753953.1 hypothetical protein LTS12_015919 [Elasticomyces elasticus]
MSSTPAEMYTKLLSLRATATRAYSLKQYSTAAESFSEAAELQDQINGEMALENADILYQYGRCLYHVAVSNSDVLGGKVAGAGTEEGGPRRKKRKVVKEKADGGEGRGGEVIGDAMKAGGGLGVVVEEEEGLMADTPVAATAGGAGAVGRGAAKPFFQITGDENWTDSEGDSDDDGDDADEAEADAQAEEEEDDFAIAYEILDTARVLLTRKLSSLQNPTQTPAAESTSTSTSTSPASSEARQIKERLADTHDLLAEISLENERFSDAVSDTRDALTLKLELYPQESSLVAEAHFKLSLALEFASVTTIATDGKGEGKGEGTQQVDEGMRGEAAGEMEKAIASCLLRVAKEEESLAGAGGQVTAAQVAERRNGIKDVREMITDMQQRLIDLKNPAVNLAGAPEGLEGLLGGLMGGGKEVSKGEQAGKIGRATDLNMGGLVRRKGKGGGAVAGEVVNENVVGGVVNGKGKRKVEDVDGDQGGSGVGGKKVKFEEGGTGGA